MSGHSTILWNPSEHYSADSNLSHYMTWLKNRKGIHYQDYSKLWQWSTHHLEDFWMSLWEYFDIRHSGTIENVLTKDEMPYNQWFTGTYVNYAEHVFRKSSANQPAIIFASESTEPAEISWHELETKVSSLQQYLQKLGVGTGDRVAAYLPCIPEATISFLATNSLGAIWSSCSPDFGLQAVIDRFAQIEPKVLIAVKKYSYNGKVIDRTTILEELSNALPSVEKFILIDASGDENRPDKFISWKAALDPAPSALFFKRVPFSDPIWILYSSGTTGLPKSIVHSQGGILLEHLKYLTFHNNIKEGDHCFWYTTTGWMMWNYIQSSLLCGGILVLYDGSPSYPDFQHLWKFADQAKIHHFGTSASFLMACKKQGVEPNQFKLSHLQSIGSTGSTLPQEGFEWVYQFVKKDIWLASMSGGTDVCSAFVGGNPLLPVYSGEIQCRALGCSLEAFDENGQPVRNQVGEMVITRPMPSMPVFFWNDPEYSRYRESYFETYPGVWRHGDWIEITSHDGIIIYGRSDATLNRGGVRIGTSEIYRALDTIPEISDSMMVCIEKAGGEFWMPLFVMLKDGVKLDQSLIKRIRTTLRTLCSPRHVPDSIHQVEDIPYTISGKKTEMPVKKILLGQPAEKVINKGSLRNPASLKEYIKLARELGLTD